MYHTLNHCLESLKMQRADFSNGAVSQGWIIWLVLRNSQLLGTAKTGVCLLTDHNTRWHREGRKAVCFREGCCVMQKAWIPEEGMCLPYCSAGTCLALSSSSRLEEPTCREWMDRFHLGIHPKRLKKMSMGHKVTHIWLQYSCTVSDRCLDRSPRISESATLDYNVRFYILNNFSSEAVSVTQKPPDCICSSLFTSCDKGVGHYHLHFWQRQKGRQRNRKAINRKNRLASGEVSCWQRGRCIN